MSSDAGAVGKPEAKKRRSPKDWLLGAAYTVGDASTGIVRHRRRSMAMVSGIVLGMMIVSSILIYTGILQDENYQSIIQSASYETSFTLSDPGTESDLWNATREIEDDRRVESMALFGGSPPSIGFDDERGDVVLTVVFPGDTVSADDGHGNWRDALIQPLFVRSNFTQTTIFDKMVGPHVTGAFDLSMDRNRTVISRYTANRLNLDVGDTLGSINVTYVKLDAQPIQAELMLIRDIEISGIYENQEVEAAGIFSSFFTSETVYLNTEMLYRHENPLLPVFEEERMFYLAVKIDQEEFTLDDTEQLNAEIDQFVNDVTRASGERVVGSNQVAPLLQPFTILNYFLIVFDFILVLPTVILSVYLLLFGLELSLEERRREIAILKVQGADARQIFALLRNESTLLFLLGIASGYMLAMVGAWLISSSTGFMAFNLDPSYLLEFIGIDFWAFTIGLVGIGLVVLFSIRRRGRAFIDQEVTEGVQRTEDRREGFVARNKLDVVMLAFGAATVAWTMLDLVFGVTEVFGYELSLGIALDTFVLGFFGTIFFWVGGALSGPRIARWASLKLERVFLRLKPLADVASIVRSGLKRRGDVARLVLIIVLTLSVATMAVVQGYTDQQYSIRTLEYEIGADYRLEFSTSADHSVEIMDVMGVSEVMPLPFVTARILSTDTEVYGLDAEGASFLAWHDDSFTDISPSDAMAELRSLDGMMGVFLGEDLATEVGAETGDEISLRVPLASKDANGNTSAAIAVKVLGLFDHVPGGIGPKMAVGGFDLVKALRSAMEGGAIQEEGLPHATTYLVGIRESADRADVRKGFDQLDSLVTVRDLEASEDNIGNQMNFGIPGLLTMTFVTSLVGALISAYAFSSIIMKRREREFAVLQTIGASRWQVYKTAVGESFVLMLVSVIWGVIVGLGVSYKMNGFFEFIGQIMGRGELDRVVFIPWLMLLAIGLATLTGMLLAVLLAARKAARLDLAVATRVV